MRRGSSPAPSSHGGVGTREPPANYPSGCLGSGEALCHRPRARWSVVGTGSKAEPGMLWFDFEPKGRGSQQDQLGRLLRKIREGEAGIPLYQEETADGAESRF